MLGTELTGCIAVRVSSGKPSRELLLWLLGYDNKQSHGGLSLQDSIRVIRWREVEEGREGGSR